MTPDFLATFRLFKLLGQLDDIAPQNVDTALEEIANARRQEIHLDWNAKEQITLSIEPLARRVSGATGIDFATCRAAAIAALAPSRAKLALEVVQELANELERSSARRS